MSFEKDSCHFILHKSGYKEFAENFMLTVNVDNVEKIWKMVNEECRIQKFGIHVTPPRGRCLMEKNRILLIWLGYAGILLSKPLKERKP
jgi:hypothetical protein